jgi:dolichyldiphosphatase
MYSHWHILRMPSTHSAVTGYYACYILLSCLYLPLHPSVPSSPALRMTLLVLVVPCSTPILLSRVSLGHHTWLQVAVGTIYGMAFALGWFIMWFKSLNVYGQVLEGRLNS